MFSAQRTIAAGMMLTLAVCRPAFAQVTDHLKCYQIKDTINLGGVVDLQSPSPQFGIELGCKVSRAKLFCVPVSKTVVSAENKSTRQPIIPLPFDAAPRPGDQICYKVKCPTLPAPIPNQPGTDQFGSHTFSKFKTSFLC